MKMRMKMKVKIPNGTSQPLKACHPERTEPTHFLSRSLLCERVGSRSEGSQPEEPLQITARALFLSTFNSRLSTSFGPTAPLLVS
jgi:hypothetical protein